MYKVPGKILLIEDDKNLGFVVQDVLNHSGYQVIHKYDGVSGLDEFKKTSYDLVLLDIMLPELDGYSVAKEIRSNGNNTPIIFITAKSMHEDKVKGFHVGADDFLTKPFSTEELKLRVNAVLKRTRSSLLKKDQDIIHQIGDFQYDYNNHKLKGKNGERRLTKKEAELLHLLCLRKNEILRRDIALVTIWGENDYFMGRSMDVYITKLRKMFQDDPRVSIKNIHNVGFKLDVE